ncbi:MAG TPA: endolytic transglycosylase MltG, partial [Bacteroidota bacterium]|nr:endolytic transglycosylase MltG [Bacteroidota bacterium]
MTPLSRRLLLWGGIVIGAIACLAVAFLILDGSPRASGGKDRLFTIERGESLSMIGRALRADRFIRSARLLSIIGKVTGTEGDFKAGAYRVPAGASTIAIHRLLVQGAQSIGKVTIPEGWTVGKIARHLEAEGVCTAADFLAAARSPTLMGEFGISGKSMEGYLYPDTYLVPRPFPAPAMAELMARTFFDNLKRIEPGWKTAGQPGLRDR